MSKKWIPLPGGPTSAHIGARVRMQPEDGSYTLAGVVTAWFGAPNAMIVRSLPEVSVGSWTSEVFPDDSWFVHRDDVPTDPDADLIELIAHGIVSAAVGEGQWERLQDSARLDWFIAARRALALVRESEAGA